ncbi:MAG: hypothetical protein HY746_03530 [Elusimicrobia bacterium]|nr:hypothetical protein [Elusimicrobiota bacterium]
MNEKQAKLKEKIYNTFKDNKFPGNWNIVYHDMAGEPFDIKKAFRGKDDWTKLDAKFLNKTWKSALSFFSEPAFRFYLPAYLIAYIDDKLPEIDVIFYLCYGLTNSHKDMPVSIDQSGKSTVYGEATCWDYSIYRFSLFTLQEVEAIVDYLRYHLENRGDYDGKTNLTKSEIREALENYWLKRLKCLKNKLKVSKP